MSLARGAGGATRAAPQTLVAAMVAIPAAGTVAAVALAYVRGGVAPVALATFALLYLVTVIGIEVGFHRYFTHRSFKCGRAVRFFLGAAGSMAGQGPVLLWTAQHREHHRFADTERDPHAPLPAGLAGFWNAHVGWLFDAAAPDIPKTVPDLLRDTTTVSVQRQYFTLFLAGLALPAAIGACAGGWMVGVESFLWGGLVRLFLVHHVTWSVNSLCHIAGARPHATKDSSRNLWILAVPTLGGAWHNNHHAFPASATNDFAAWQIDPGAWLIRGCAGIGLVWDVREPPQEWRGA
jgi:stearoyl-CoA desaturase (delta-9 desaturase)